MNTRTAFTRFGSALLALIFFSCDRDNGLPEPIVDGNLVELRYDGANVTAPLLTADTWEAAIRFSPAQLSGLDGRSLSEVIFHLGDVPTSATLIVYQGTGATAPATQVYTQGITSDLMADSWHRIPLDNPVTVDASQDLWVSLRFLHDRQMGSLGCDAGPADDDGEWLFANSDGRWLKLSGRSNGQIDINWNLRAVIE